MPEYVNRKNTDCAKWDDLRGTFGADGLLPLWVADMDFRIDENILKAVDDYLATGVIGYYKVPDSYYDAFIGWEAREHGLDVEREWIRYSPGVVTALNIAVRLYTQPGEAVLICTPVYYPFSKAINNNGRRLITSGLVRVDDRYYIDFEDLERKIKENDVRMFIMCSPHNPVSRVWSEEELRTVMDICRRHNVLVISDEIHQDLVYDGFRHIPALSAADAEDKVIIFTSASKSFNIAGLRNSFVIIRDEHLRELWDGFAQGLNIETGDPLGYIAAEAAYTHGKKWLDDVRAQICWNYRIIRDAFADALPDVKLTPLEGTYLAWADFAAYLSPAELQPFMQDKCGLAFDYGSWFGGSGDTCIRINLATSEENIRTMTGHIIENI